LVGSGLLAYSGWIHVHLWSAGYRAIPTIGPLFMFQAVTAFVLAAAVALFRRAELAAIGAAFALSTAAGLLLSVEVGLFGFQDSFAATDATLSLVVELVTGVLLLASAAGLWLVHRTWLRAPLAAWWRRRSATRER
jgi:hypothetical protein